MIQARAICPSVSVAASQASFQPCDARSLQGQNLSSSRYSIVAPSLFHRCSIVVVIVVRCRCRHIISLSSSSSTSLVCHHRHNKNNLRFGFSSPLPRCHYRGFCPCSPLYGLSSPFRCDGWKDADTNKMERWMMQHAQQKQRRRQQHSQQQTQRSHPKRTIKRTTTRRAQETPYTTVI